MFWERCPKRKTRRRRKNTLIRDSGQYDRRSDLLRLFRPIQDPQGALALIGEQVQRRHNTCRHDLESGTALVIAAAVDLYQALSSSWQKTQSLKKRTCRKPFAVCQAGPPQQSTNICPIGRIAATLSRRTGVGTACRAVQRSESEQRHYFEATPNTSLSRADMVAGSRLSLTSTVSSFCSITIVPSSLFHAWRPCNGAGLESPLASALRSEDSALPTPSSFL